MYDFDEVLKKRDKLPPEQLERFDKLLRDVDHNIDYAKHVLNCTSWWHGYRGMLMGTPQITTDPDIPTACVAIDSVTGKIDYYFNLYFAAGLSCGDIAFVMAHECLHLVFGDLEAIKTYHIQYLQIWNVVTDAFINEYLHRSLNWTKGVEEWDKLDFMTSEGIRWTDLPPEIQEKWPVDEKGEADVTAIQIYEEFLEYLEKQGVDPNKFEKEVENKRFGKQVWRRQRQDQNRRGGGKVEVVNEKTFVEPGDMVWVKSKRKYGLIKDLRRTRDQKGEADIDCPENLSLDDMREANRAIGITHAIGKKTYPLSRKILDEYANLRAAAGAGGKPSWDDLAKAVGVPQIGELTRVDIAKEEYDKRTLMSPEELEAESIRKYNEIARKARATRAAAAASGGGRYSM